MRIVPTTVYVDAPAKALDFYGNVVGFVKIQDLPTGAARPPAAGSRGARVASGPAPGRKKRRAARRAAIA